MSRAVGGQHVLLAAGGGACGGQVQGGADLPLAAAGAEGLDGEAVAEVEVVGRAMAGRAVGAAGGVNADLVAKHGRAPGLVEGDPEVHFVAQRGEAGGGVVGEVLRRVAGGPAAGVLERLGQVPVVERHGGADAGAEQRVNQAVVVVEALGVLGADPGGKDAGPGERETVGAHAQIAHQRHVLGVAVELVARHVAGMAVLDLAGRAAESVPDARPAAVLARSALDLVAGRRRAPQKAVGKLPVRHRAAPSRNGVLLLPEPDPLYNPGDVPQWENADDPARTPSAPER